VRRLRPLALFACVIAGLSTAPGASPASSGRSWARPQIRLVVSHGLMARTVASFRPNDTLTQGELSLVVADLTEQPPKPAADPAAPVTMAQLDARLVRVLDMSDDAALFQEAAAGAGLRPPTRFGTEVVARLLGLRTNHPTGQDDLERLPNDPAPRAEAAFSVAQVLTLSDWQKQEVEDAAATFELPEYTPWQRRVLTTAVKFIGFPYVWGGEFETPQSPYGAQPQGGFDCSGFVWRVFKIQSYPGAPQLSDTLRGRTAAAMAGEVPRRQRIKPARLLPADAMFFGPGGPRAKPARIDHAGIYLGNGWLINSSRYGVALAPVGGWYESRLAWGRRPIVEAGL
jgi:cell wall-associated NlpC family hydrolase